MQILIIDFNLTAKTAYVKSEQKKIAEAASDFFPIAQ